MSDIRNYKQFDVSINVLSRAAKIILSQLLNPIKYIPTKENLARDWTGLADLLQFSCEDVAFFRSTGDPTNTVLQKWSTFEDSTISRLLCCLQKMDRFDIIEDIFDIIYTDVGAHERNNACNVDTSLFITNKDYECYRVGLPPMQYDASILYANEDIDFAGKLVRKLEAEGNFNIFVPERDLLAGIIEHNATMQIIASRCNKLITILSPEFLKSSVNHYFLSFAQSIGIDQRVRKILPLVYKDCEIPPELRPLHKLVYKNWIEGDLYNYFQKLVDALRKPVRCNSSSLPEIPASILQNPAYPSGELSASMMDFRGNCPLDSPVFKKKKRWLSRVNKIFRKKKDSIALPS